jgi:hypothetical protein
MEMAQAAVESIFGTYYEMGAKEKEAEMLAAVQEKEAEKQAAVQEKEAEKQAAVQEKEAEKQAAVKALRSELLGKEAEMREREASMQERQIENVLSLVSGEHFGVSRAMSILNVEQALHGRIMALLAERGIAHSE